MFWVTFTILTRNFKFGDVNSIYMLLIFRLQDKYFPLSLKTENWKLGHYFKWNRAWQFAGTMIIRFAKKRERLSESEDWNIPKLRVRKTTCLFVICKLDRRETKTGNKSLVPCSWLLLVGDIFILLMENYTRLFFFHQFVSQARSSLRVS